MRSIRVIANTNSKAVPTRNIYDGVTGPTGAYEQCNQVATGATGEIETVQGLTGPVAGVKNIIIAGYTGTA